MTDLRQRIDADTKAALKLGDKARVSALRLVLAAIRQREVDERTELADAEVLGLLERLAKQRRESIEQFARAGREDLVAQERFELDVISGYMPEPLDDAAVDAAIEAALAETGAASVRDMGKVMSRLKTALQGRADLGEVSTRVRRRLG